MTALKFGHYRGDRLLLTSAHFLMRENHEMGVKRSEITTIQVNQGAFGSEGKGHGHDLPGFAVCGWHRAICRRTSILRSKNAPNIFAGRNSFVLKKLSCAAAQS